MQHDGGYDIISMCGNMIGVLEDGRCTVKRKISINWKSVAGMLGTAFGVGLLVVLALILNSLFGMVRTPGEGAPLTPEEQQGLPTPQLSLTPISTTRAEMEIYIPKELVTASWGTSEKDIGLTEGRPPYGGPQAITVDRGGNVYILDTVNYRVKKYDNHGNFKKNIPYNQNIGAIDMCVGNDGSIYLLNSLDYSVYQYNLTGEVLRQYPKPEWLYQITRIDIDKNNNLVAGGLLETSEPDRPLEKVTVLLGTKSEVFSELRQKATQKRGRFYRGGIAYTHLEGINEKEGTFRVINENRQVIAELPIETSKPIAAVPFFDTDLNGNIYIVLETFLDSYTTKISSQVRKYNREGQLIAQFELPDGFYTVPARRVVVDDPGSLYLLLPLEHQVKVIKWHQR